MNDAQTWTLIGGFFMLVVTISLTLRAVRAEIGGLRSTLEARLDHLDRDVQAVNRLMEG